MKPLRTWSAFALGMMGAVVACSADGGGSDGADGGSDTGGSDGSGPGGNTNIGLDSISDLGQGGAGPGTEPPDTSGEIPDPPLISCEAKSDCCEAVPECEDESQFVCTSEGYCGVIRETGCTDHADCQGDTYCCDADCRDDGEDEGVCIPANIPPGIECNFALEVGEFSPDVQCEWSGPGASDPSPTSKHVLTTPLVADLPFDSGDSAELVVITTAVSSTTPDSAAPGVIRILSGQDCSLLASISGTTRTVSALATPAIGDIDDDGIPEIVAKGESNSIIVFEWNGTAYVESWARDGNDNTLRSQPWAGPSLHDLDNDGKSEVLLAGVVWDYDGTQLFAGTGINQPWNGLIAVAADVDNDGKVELVSNRAGQIALSEWNGSSWALSQNLGGSGSHFAVADFGSMDGSNFDAAALDGIAEVVAVDDETGVVSVRTITGDLVFSVDTGSGSDDRGGPPVVGDFDDDGFPEIGVAGKTRFRVFDLECPTGCNDESQSYVRWSKPSQDASSAQTGATIFDFDGDGNAEVVYADECFLRVYAGTDGKVLFSSYRTSTTWYESPLVADIDNDQNTEIVVNSNDYNTACPSVGGSGGAYVDPIHLGVSCTDNAACPFDSTCDSGLCRCTTDADCCGDQDLITCGLSCADPIDASSGKVCRATHPGDSASVTGIRVLRDRLDRWASSRSIWNQHAYSITNVTDDAEIPMTEDWTQNFSDPELNNFRQNVQGTAGFEDLPDITGRFSDEEPCVTGTSEVYVQATVCNRGARTVGANLPATFYVGDPKDGEILCTSYTDGPVPIANPMTGQSGCKLVYCAIGDEDLAGESITLMVNDDGKGGKTTVECREDNNSDKTTIKNCTTQVPR